MAYEVRYRNTTAALDGTIVTVELLQPDYAGEVFNFMTTLDGVKIERSSSDQRLYGIFGTAARVATIGLSPADFVVNEFTEWRCDIYNGAQLVFTGFIVLDDITTELRAEPVQMELTFTDNLGLLSDTPAPFQIDTFFKPTIEIVAECIEATGLEIDINVFLSIYPETGNNLTGTLSQVKMVPRTWASSLTEWKSCKEVLDDILFALRCRLYQHNGEWVIFRVHDLLDAGQVYSGFKYAYGTLAESPTSIDTEAEGLTLLAFTQQVTHRRAVRQVRDTYTFDAGFQLLNSDLQTLGALQSSTIDGPNTISRYDATYWTNVNGQTSYIEVVVETATGAELSRKLVLPFQAVNSGGAGARYVRSAPIMCSIDDIFFLSIQSAGSADSSFSSEFFIGFLFVGVSGTRYKVQLRSVINADGKFAWTATSEDIGTMTWGFKHDLPGSNDLLQFKSFSPWQNEDILNTGFPKFPENGLLYVAIFGFNNNITRRADVDAYIKDIDFSYKYYINESLLIESQQHTADVPISSLNELQQDLQVDDSQKYNSIGAIYDSNNDNTRAWLSDSMPSPTPLGQLNTTEQMQIEGVARRVISGLFRGAFGFQNVLTFDSKMFVPTRLTTILHRGEVDGEFSEIGDAADVNYQFKFNYKTRL